MAFESVRGYVGLASGLTELTRDRALEAARGLLTLPAAGIATGGKVAVQAGALADELFSAAAANRSDLRALVRSEVDIAITRLGLVSVQRLDDVQAEAARLRAEVARLRASSASASASPSTASSSSARKTSSRSSRAPKPAAKAARKAQSAAPAKNAQSAAPAKKARSTKPVKKAQPAARKAAKVTAPRRSSVTTRARPASG